MRDGRQVGRWDVSGGGNGKERREKKMNDVRNVKVKTFEIFSLRRDCEFVFFYTTNFRYLLKPACESFLGQKKIFFKYFNITF
jgi:hypothetical protein